MTILIEQMDKLSKQTTVINTPTTLYENNWRREGKQVYKMVSLESKKEMHKIYCNKVENVLNKIYHYCSLKNWSSADQCHAEYIQLVKDKWEDYDTHLNYRFNKCGMCRCAKKALVKRRWADSEMYPIANQLACVNKECRFYLVINTDRDAP